MKLCSVTWHQVLFCEIRPRNPLPDTGSCGGPRDGVLGWASVWAGVSFALRDDHDYALGQHDGGSPNSFDLL